MPLDYEIDSSFSSGDSNACSNKADMDHIDDYLNWQNES